jgi:glucose/arabinose dehydrogenase
MTARATESKGMRRLAFALFALVLGGPAGARAELLELLTGDANGPIYLTHVGDERLFIAERGGRIRVFENGTLRPEPFLDLSGPVAASGEGGLLSLAFHPDYADPGNGAFYVSYTTDDPITGFTSVVSRFHVSAGDPNLADPAEDVLLELPQPFTNHNGGQIAFGLDGMLYVGFGDGGDRDDPGCRSQRVDTWHGKLLRLDVEPTGGAAPFYSIPADNPFAGGAGGVLPEIWAFGLRNPWRFSFDRTAGDLWIGDVGQDAVEEVDLEPAGSAGGLNYGWKLLEGTSCANPEAESCPASVPGCASPVYTPPVSQYGHGDGNRSITGGYRYRGALAPGFVGTYVFGDFGSGRIFALREKAPGEWQRSTLLAAGPGWASFGEGADGELYALDLGGDAVYQLDLTAALSGADRACVVGLNQAFAKTAKARARQLERCRRQAAEGKLPAGAEACAAAADPKLDNATAKTAQLAAAECEVLPPFGATDAATVNAAATGAPLALLRDVFGGDFDAAFRTRAADPAGARCQARAAAELLRCQALRAKELVRCKKPGLRDGSVKDAVTLGACLEADPQGRLAKCAAAGGKLATKLLPGVCAGVDLAAAFPGCAAADAGALAACAERADRCRACAALGAADAFPLDCDAFDDGAANGSCP